jgi:hypothetical protein
LVAVHHYELFIDFYLKITEEKAIALLMGMSEPIANNNVWIGNFHTQRRKSSKKIQDLGNDG